MEKNSALRESLRLIGSILLSCVIGALLAAVAAAIILRYVAVESPAKRYDDVEKILAQYHEDDFRGATIAPDGTLSVKLEKNDTELWQIIRAVAAKSGVTIPAGQPSAGDMARLRAILATKGSRDVDEALATLRRAHHEP